MRYRFQASETFWKKFYKLAPDQKESVRRAWLIFKENPYDARLGTHRISSLSAQYRKTIQSVVIESNLRIVFFAEGDVI
jgi:hypothetical protein